MDIRFLQSLVAVVETGSITAAARREKITPAAVSQRIQALERLLGRPLLNRGAHSARPTEACLALLPRARLLIEETARLKNDIEGEPLAGEIRIGAISTALTGLMPQVLHDTVARAPALKLRLTPGDSLYLYEQLLAGRLDAAILVEPPFQLPKTLTGHVLRTEPLMLMTRTPVLPRDLVARILAAPFIRYDPASWGGRLAANWLDSRGLFPEVLCDVDALEIIAILVARGLGQSLVPAWAGLNAAGTFLTPVPDSKAHARRILFIHHSVPGRPRALSFLAGLVRTEAAREGIMP